MAPKSKTPEGELTAPELRKLIRAHNILSKITIPKGTDRGGLIKLIEGKNYVVDHGNKAIKPKQQRGKQITLKKAEELTKPKPVSDAVKKKRAEKKKEQEEQKEKDIKIAKKEAVQEFKTKKKEAQKLKSIPPRKILKKENLSNTTKESMGETAFIKQQKKLQLEKQKETRRALLKQNVKVDKTTRRGKPVKKEEKEEKDLKIGDTYLFKIKDKDFEGIALKINDKSVSMLLRWVNGNILKKPIKKENIIKRLGGTNYDEDLGERYEMSKKKTDKKEILKSVKKGKGNPINKLTGPEAEELWNKIQPLFKSNSSLGLHGVTLWNATERKQFFKELLSGKTPPKTITDKEYDKLNEGQRAFYIKPITGLTIKKVVGERSTGEKIVRDVFKTDYSSKEFMLRPSLYTDTLFGREIHKWDMKKVIEIVEDYLKGDIGTKKKKGPLVVKDFNIILRGKNYNKEEFLKWVDNEGYKLSKGQLEKLNYLVVSYKLQSFRTYFNSNGVLVLVPTLKFNASEKVYNKETKQYDFLDIGEVLSELSGERGGSVLKLELKPKVKIDLTPEKIKGFDMTRLKFIKEELPQLKKSFTETKGKLKIKLTEYEQIGKNTNRDKNEYSPYTFISDGQLKVIKELQRAKAKDWLTNIDKEYNTETRKNDETKLYAPQELREWFEKNNIEIQRLNLINENLYSTIKSYESKERQLKKIYDID